MPAVRRHFNVIGGSRSPCRARISVSNCLLCVVSRDSIFNQPPDSNRVSQPIPQEQFPPVGLSLRQQGQENVSHLVRNLFCPENFERLRENENLGDGWRFFQAPAAQSFREACHSRVKFAAGVWRSQCNDFCLTVSRGVFDPKVKATSTQWVPDASLFVGCQHNKRNAFSPNRAEFRNAEGPNAQEFQQHCFKCLAYFV